MVSRQGRKAACVFANIVWAARNAGEFARKAGVFSFEQLNEQEEEDDEAEGEQNTIWWGEAEARADASDRPQQHSSPADAFAARTVPCGRSTAAWGRGSASCTNPRWRVGRSR